MDLLANYSFDQVCRLVELRKHLCASDRHVMVDHIIHQLSIAHLFQVSYRPHPHFIPLVENLQWIPVISPPSHPSLSTYPPTSRLHFTLALPTLCTRPWSCAMSPQPRRAVCAAYAGGSLVQLYRLFG